MVVLMFVLWSQNSCSSLETADHTKVGVIGGHHTSSSILHSAESFEVTVSNAWVLLLDRLLHSTLLDQEPWSMETVCSESDK